MHGLKFEVDTEVFGNGSLSNMRKSELNAAKSPDLRLIQYPSDLIEFSLLFRRHIQGLKTPENCKPVIV